MGLCPEKCGGRVHRILPPSLILGTLRITISDTSISNNAILTVARLKIDGQEPSVRQRRRRIYLASVLDTKSDLRYVENITDFLR